MNPFNFSGPITAGLTIAAVVIPAFIACALAFLAEHGGVGPRGSVVGVAVWLITLITGLVYIISLPWGKVNWHAEDDIAPFLVGIAIFAAAIITVVSTLWMLVSIAGDDSSPADEENEDPGAEE